MSSSGSILSLNLSCGDFPKRCDDCLRTYDPAAIRAEFPILATQVHGRALAYLDNAASTQKPQEVIDRLVHYYEHEHANVHRGVYQLSQSATAAYEQAREKVRGFINAASAREVIFTRGATEGINLVASSFCHRYLGPGDEVLVSAMEHHSNIVPWQMATQRAGAKLGVIPIDDHGELQLEALGKMLSPRVKLVAITHLSNSLGTVNPVDLITEMAHSAGARVLVDGAQWVGHFPTDVQQIDCDFYVLSGHKMFGPTGIGAVYGRESLLVEMPPYQGGGDMIETVTFSGSTYAQPPAKFEAGTPNIADAIGLGATVDFLHRVGFSNLLYYEHGLLRYAEARLREVPGLRIIGEAPNKSSVISFVLQDPLVAPLDIAMHLDRCGIAVRTGHHCCMPVMHRMGVTGTTRASLAFYNTVEEVNRLADALLELVAQQKPRVTVSASAAGAAAPAALTTWPEPFADSPAAAADELAETFEFLEDWEQRDSFILDLGDKLPPMPESLKAEACRVHGCMSTVHMLGRLRPGASDRLDLLADSDAHLVRGLIAVLQHLYSGQRAEEILQFDTEKFLRRIGLEQHLSMGRRNGLEGMIRRIRQMAKAIKDSGALPPELCAG
jgi:cysteine desulfurase/selenocysteine lyase